MAKTSPAAQQKVAKVMHEWGQGQLHSGSKKGPLVPKTKASQSQAVAIALSEARAKGLKAPPAPRKRKS
jgi:hypothetical protein